MSEKIPFLQMFSALQRCTELSVAVEGWIIVSAAINKARRSAAISIEGAQGAGPDLIGEVQETLCRAYGLNSVKIECAAGSETVPAEEELCAAPTVRPAAPEMDAFARTEALRAQALKNIPRAVPSSQKKKATKDHGKVIYGHVVKKKPIPMGELNLDMGTVVIEGDVFAVDHRELKKRNAWVVAFDVTDYTGSVRVSKFVPAEENAKAIVDGVKKGQRLIIQGRLNMDRFYGDMVLEPASIMEGVKTVREDTAPVKRVELHMHTNASSMDALTCVGAKTDPKIMDNAIKRLEKWGHKAVAITDHGVAHAFPNAWHSAKNIKILYGVEAYYINDVDDRVVIHGDHEQDLSGEIVCFDIETTGLNKKQDVIIEIGAVVLRDGKVTETFNTFAAPGRILDLKVIQLTGITDEMLVGAPSQEEALRAFLAFVGDRPLAAHTRNLIWALLPRDAENTGCRLPTPRSIP